MKTNMQRLAKERWENSLAYRDSWAERNNCLISMLEDSGVSMEHLSFSEYGCGPNKPFSTEISKRLQCKVTPLDLHAWDEKTVKLDLDALGDPAIPHSDVGVLSGVVEYLQSPKASFSQLRGAHQYLLFSYRIFQYNPAGPIEAHSKVLSDRARKGWRNHLPVHELLNVIDSFGYIVETDVWQKQSLFLLKSW